MQIPSQKLISSAKNDKWKEDTVDAIISQSIFGEGRLMEEGYRQQRTLLNKCYGYANNEFFQEDYSHVTDPYNRTEDENSKKVIRDIPIKNYPIIKPLLEVLLGEKLKRPINTSIYVTNRDVVTRKEEELKEVMKKTLEDMMVNKLTDLELVEMEKQEVPEPQEVRSIFEKNYKDTRSIIGQQIVNYLEFSTEFRDKDVKGFKHWLISGMSFTLKGTSKHDPTYRILNPLNVDFEKSEDIEYIEDSQWAVYRSYMLPNEIIDSYHDELNKSEIDKLNKFIETGEYESNKNQDLYNTYNIANNLGLEVIKVYWKSFKKIKIITYVEDGVTLERIELDTYKLKRGEKSQDRWISEAWEGTRIAGDIYLRVKPIDVQRRDMDNISICKLPINGKIYSDMNAMPISFVMMLIPYQIDYNVYRWKLNNTLRKNKDRLAQIDISIKPNGWSVSQWIEYIENYSFLFVDYSKEGANFNNQHQSVLDLTIQSIETLLRAINLIYDEVYFLSGVNRQRLGNITQNDLKGVTEQAIISSNNNTEYMFSSYENLMVKDLLGLIDYTKVLWIDGKKASYILSDNSIKFLEVDGIQHSETNYGIFISDKTRDRDNMNIMKQLANSFVQNGASISSIVSVLESGNMSELKNKIEELEDKMASAQQQAEQMKMQQMEQLQQMEQMKIQNDNEQKELDRQNKIQVATISATWNDKTEDDIILEEKKIEVDKDKIDKTYQLGIKKIQSDEKISKQRELSKPKKP